MPYWEDRRSPSMAVPHYVYLLLKMSGNAGVLSLRGDLLKSFECDKKAIDHAATI